MSDLDIPMRRWTRIEYEQLIDAGILHEDDPVELVDGLLVLREPLHPPHATATLLALQALQVAFGPGWHVRVHQPVALDDDSEPEPDLSVAAGSPRDYLDEHPARPQLIVEVAHRSLSFDRTFKAGLYARAGVADYWIINLVDEVLEVYREPVEDPTARHGWRYRTVQRLGRDAFVSPLASSSARIAVADLLP